MDRSLLTMICCPDLSRELSESLGTPQPISPTLAVLGGGCGQVCMRVITAILW